MRKISNTLESKARHHWSDFNPDSGLPYTRRWPDCETAKTTEIYLHAEVFAVPINKRPPDTIFDGKILNNSNL